MRARGGAAAALLVAASCSAPPAQSAAPRWACPGEDWVEGAAGGCGAAAQLCAEEGAARAGACDQVRWREAHARDDGAPGFWRSGDGRLHGGWPDDDELVGAPPEVAARAGVSVCPAGWERTSDGACAPALAPACPAGSGAVPSVAPATRCTATGEDQCSAGEFPALPADAPDARRVYRVRAGAAAVGADGSVERPFASVDDALAAHGDDPRAPVLLVARGDYGPLRLTRSAPWVVGRCAAYVRVRAEGAAPALTVEGAAQATVRGVHFAGGAPGVWVHAGGRASLARVAVTGAATASVLAQDRGSELRATDLYVADTSWDAAGTKGWGVAAVEGARVTVERAHVARSHESAVLAALGATLTLRDAVVRDTRGRRDGSQGNAALAFDGALALERVWVRGAVGTGVTASGTRASAEATDVHVRGAGSRDDVAVGLYAVGGGALTAERVSVTESAGRSIEGATGGLVAVREALVDGAALAGTGTARTRTGACVFARMQGTVHAERLRCARSEGSAVVAFGQGARAELVDAVVEGAQSTGVFVGDQGFASCLRCLLDGARETGVNVNGAGAACEVRASTIRATRPDAEGLYGSGATALDGARLTLEDVALDDNHHLGLGATRGATVTGRRLVVRRTARDERGYGGVGAQALTDGVLTLRAVRFDANATVGFSADGAGASLTLEDALTTGGVAADATGGFVQSSASATLRRVAVTDVVEAALIVRNPDRAVSAVDAEDFLVERVRPGRLGFGGALLSFGNGRVRARRVSVRDVYGAALAAGPFNQLRTYSGSADLADVDLRGVRESTVRIAEENGALRTTGPSVAYGLYVGPRGSFVAERVSVRDAQYGFYLLQGALTVRDALFAGNRSAAGASTGAEAPAALTLERVQRSDNADDTVRLDVELPETSTLPPPSALCPAEGCAP